MKRTFSQALIVTLLLTPAVFTQEALNLVQDGQPRAVIVVPKEPNHGETKAAEELQTYFKKASGAELPIQSEGNGAKGAKIILGRACKDLKNKPTGDGFTIETHGDAICIAGGNERGTLYGAYAFLEDQLGIRWFMPGEIGEVVPETKTITIPTLSKHEQPDFEYRWIGRGNDWVARNRSNVGIPQIGINIFRSAHTFRTFLDPRKYRDEHPEWYALIGGRRYKRLSHNNQICTSNPDAVNEVIKNMREFLDKNPDVNVVTLFPNDGNGFCECENCKALDEPEWATVEEINQYGRATGFRGYGTLSRRLMIFNNTVAEALHKTHPNVMVKVGAYSCYTSPPKDKSLKYAPNIIVQICHSWCHNHAITDPNCPINADFRKAIEGWSKITPGGVMLYEYYYKCAQCELPFPIIHAMRRDYPYFKKIGVKGVYTQYSTNWGTLTLPYYIPTRLLWNADADVDKLLDDFYTKFYGAASAPMKKYYERLEKAAIDSGLHFSPPYYRFPEVFTGECLKDCQQYLDEAKPLADTDKIRQRIAIVQTSLDYTKLVMDYVNSVRAVDKKIGNYRWRLDIKPEFFAEAREKAKVIRKFMARPECKNVIRRKGNYVDRLLNPEFTFQDRWDRTDAEQLKHRSGIGLTKRAWLETAPKHELAEIPKTFSLWIYGNDFDADEKESEHELFFLGKGGKRISIGPLPPKGQACDRKTACVVYDNLNWPDDRRDALRLEIVNRPGHWSGSTFLAAYVMPPGLGVSHEKATKIIQDHPDWPRRRAIGFTELGFRGMANPEGAPLHIDVELVGSPKDTAPPPE
ncbi:MAG: DUF4838 domain-containing protein [Planctomycetes bacterium]|nr:DUF4838 domain-containing protein [Planctomycetota bacterium]